MTADTLADKGMVQEALDGLIEASSALTALLITKEGTALNESGDTTFLNSTAMAALIAGMFSATHEVARMVGEKQFSILLQQGENRHIHISLVAGSMMLVVVFEDYQRIGRVRHEARKTAQRIASIFEEKALRQGVRPDLSVPAFREYALNLIDRIFVSE